MKQHSLVGRDRWARRNGHEIPSTFAARPAVAPYLMPLHLASLAAIITLLLAFSGCTESHASAGHDHAAEPAAAVTFKAGRGLRLSDPALAFAGVATAEFTGRLPAAALLRTARGDFVYVANDGWLLRTPVKLADGNGVSFAVGDGLYEGDVIVVGGAQALWLAEIQAVNGGVGGADGH